MPLTPHHKQQTRERIVERARHLFNRHGFSDVTIDDVMAAAGLTRGGFYNHFKNKDELYVAALEQYAEAREAMPGPAQEATLGRRVFEHYASLDHVDDLDGQCPLMALPSDVARAGPDVRAAYRRVLLGLTGLFEQSVQDIDQHSARNQSYAIAATCVGAAVLARTLDDAVLADDICAAARRHAAEIVGW